MMQRNTSTPKNNTGLKVLYIVNARIPNARAHGIQIVHTCESIGRQGVNLTLVTSRQSGQHPSLEEHYGIAETFTHKQIFTIDIVGLPFRYLVRNLSFFVSAAVYIIAAILASCVKREQIALYVRGELMLFLIPFTFIVPIFFETHQIRNYEYWYRVALLRARGIVVVTENLKKKFINEYRIDPKKILVARDAVNLSHYSSVKCDKSLWVMHEIPTHKSIALYAGTLSREKGVDTLAEASKYVPDTVQIVFLGGTPEQIAIFRGRYRDYKNVSVIGRVEHTEVPAYITSADVLVLPDSAEFTYSNLYTSPMKLFEYMASGRPIVASRVPSLCEVLDDDSAFFFNSGDAKELAQRIGECTTDHFAGERRAANARILVESFTWDERGKEIVTHIRKNVEHV